MIFTHRTLWIIGFLGIVFLVMSGCGRKQLHVATSSGNSGQEGESQSRLQAAGSDQTGLENLDVSESGLENQAGSAEPPGPQSVMSAHEPSSTGQSETSTGQLEGLTSQSEGSEVTPATASTSGSLGSDASQSPQGTVPSGPGREIQAQPSSQPAAESLAAQPGALTAGSADSDTAPPLSAFDTSEEDSQSSGSAQDEGLTPSTEPLDENATPVERMPDNIAVAKVEPSEAGEEQLERIREEEMETVAAGIQDVFFEFDSWMITGNGKEALEYSANWLDDKPSTKLLIAGHCDERGTQAYNMILGKKRAGAIWDYLVGLGIEPSRLVMISYGKDKPFCTDSTEVCYQLNRRGHLIVVQQPE